MKRLQLKHRGHKTGGNGWARTAAQHHRQTAAVSANLAENQSTCELQANPVMGLSTSHAVQAKSNNSSVAVAPASDPLEREADQCADTVMAGKPVNGEQLQLSPQSRVQRLCTQCQQPQLGEDRDDNADDNSDHNSDDNSSATVHAKQQSDSGGGAASVANLNTSGGQALGASSQHYFGAHFGRNLSDVRIHNNAQAQQQAQQIGARAFTYGSHIYFNRNQYQPHSHAGGWLLAHELTHTLQQSPERIQRRCDPLLLAARSAPVFFPQTTEIMSIYSGATVLSRSPLRSDTVGLVQQALVDLNFAIGSWGPRRDGVDGKFGADTATGVTAFQFSESLPTTAVVDQQTLQCLDEVRSKLTVPQHQRGSVPAAEFQINEAQTGGRDADIFFARGTSAFNFESMAKLLRMSSAQRGCQLTLEGYVSEDEKTEFGNGLATDRINAVDAMLTLLGHGGAGVCTPADSPIRIARPLPEASARIGDYRARRKVELVARGASSTTAACPPGASPTDPIDAATDGVTITEAIDASRDRISTALSQLVPGNVDGNAALTAYFGSTGRRTAVRNNLLTWRTHIDSVIRARHQKGSGCNSICRTVIAFNSGVGPSAMMTLCDPFFSASFSIPQELTAAAEKQAFVILHEAGHGSIGTKDLGYGHRRLVEFLAAKPALALRNTDSYTRLVFCLSGSAAFCAPRVPIDNIDATQIPAAADQAEIRRGLAWLQSWLQWVGQDMGGAYATLAKSRREGSWSNRFYQREVFLPFTREFDLHRPSAEALPTMAEQMLVAAAADRYELMSDGVREGMDIELDPVMRWQAGSPGPAKKLFVDSAYLALSTDRQRVERLLPLIIVATQSIGAGQRSHYEKFTKADARRNWGNQP